MDKHIDTITSLWLQISKLIAQKSNVSYEERAATMLQFHALMYLENHPRATSSEIAKHLTASLSSIAQLTDRLDKTNFIIREGDEKDRRIVRISLTDLGKEHLKQMRKNKKERMKKLFAGIEENDIKELIRIQEKLVKNLEEK